MSKKVKTRVGEYYIGTNIRLKGEDFWRRVNSDGTLSRIGDGTEGTVHFNHSLVPSERNKLAKKYQREQHKNVAVPIIERFNPVGNIQRMFKNKEAWARAFTPFDWNMILRNSQGNNSADIPNIVINAAINSGLDAVNLFSDKNHNQYYSGNISGHSKDLDENKYTGPKTTESNAINAFTYQDYSRFQDSPIGIGNYRNNTKYNQLPAYTGQFYSDNIYLPTSLKTKFINSNGKWGYFDKDETWTPHNTYDARNHRVQIEYQNNIPTLLFEDVFNTNNELVDQYNYPFILNQRVPVIFTDDESKLNFQGDFVPTMQTMLDSDKNGITFYSDKTSIK